MFSQVAPPILYALLLTAIVYRWRFLHLPGIRQSWVAGAWWIRIAAGLLFWFIYTFYYTVPSESDALRYFQDALTIKTQWHENREVFWSFMLGRDLAHPKYLEISDHLVAWRSAYQYGLSNDCSTIIRINVLLSFISFGNYHVHALVLSFFAFTGFAALYHAFIEWFRGKEKLLFVACFLLPSVIFWSSSVMKEAPLFCCLGLLFYSLNRLRTNHRQWWPYLLLAFCFILLIYLKVYVIISLLPALIFLWLIYITGKRRMIIKFLTVHVICFLVAQQAHHFFIGGDFIYVLHKRQVDFYNVAFLTNAKSVVDIPAITTASNFFIHYPHAFFLTYFRPHLFEAKSILYLLFALENFFYLMMCLAVVLFFKKPTRQDAPRLLMIISYILILAAILGNCVPILGAMVRYKVVALPMLVILCFSLLDIEKIRRVASKITGASRRAKQ